MLRAIYRISLWLRRLVLAALLAGVVAFGPALWVEATCVARPGAPDGFASALPAASRRAEGRTYSGFARAYVQTAHEDYARILEAGDPHDYAVLPAVAGFWQALCPLAARASALGEFDAAARREAYGIGARFTAGMLLRAAYEETVGRLATMARGPERAALDDVVAGQAAARAEFLRDLPWHQYSYGADADALIAANAGTPRDWERTVALNIGYRAQAALAWAARRALPGDGIEPLTLRMVVSGVAPEDLAGVEGVTVIGPLAQGVEVEVPRLQGLAQALTALAETGADFAEIAGNDDILIAIDAPGEALPDALYAYPRQGSDSRRNLIAAKVPELAARLRDLPASGATLAAAIGY
ncbi:MAG: hypothetical protein N2Z62_03155 [Rhodobacteraceae bacterium]|nr:hypothetical protein [Paracoccaceae bacterium]